MAKDSMLAKLVDENELVELVKQDEFLTLVNMPTPEVFVKDHPLAKGVKYIPIDKVEFLLTKLFQNWHVEIISEGQMLNSIYVKVRLHYYHPVAKEWKYQDGIGATAIQVDKGQDASNLGAIKSDAIQKALPAAESYAVKDAAEKIGRIFGKDLNRRETLAFDPAYATEDNKKKVEEMQKAARALLDGVDDEVPTDRAE
jgi:hypothetical protein